MPTARLGAAGLLACDSESLLPLPTLLQRVPHACRGLPCGRPCLQSSRPSQSHTLRQPVCSHWLRDRARPLVEAALRSSPAPGATAGSDAIAAHLLALLSGHQVAAAAALAAATGNPRLATLLAQSGAKAVGAAELAEQLRVWEESGCERHINAALRRVYQLLAGQVDQVTPDMQLDWRRALGVHLWYGCQPTATGEIKAGPD